MRMREAAKGVGLRVVVLAVAASAVLSARPALAEKRHRIAQAVAGEQIRLGRYVHFKASTCLARSVPKIVLREKPTKGTLSITKSVAPLRKARTERGKRCIGRPLPGATVQYTPFANAEGVETVAYDVIYPESCTRCRNRQVQVSVTINRPAESQMATPREAPINPDRAPVEDDADEM